MNGEAWFRGACLAAFAAVILTCLVVSARVDLWQPYEPDLAETAREMWEGHDWIIPSLNGHPYYEKPPLYYWSAIAAARVSGTFSEFTARIPSLLAGVVMLLTAAWMAKDLFGKRSSWLASALFVTTPVFVYSSTKGMTDGLLCAATTLSLYLYYSVLWGRSSGKGLRCSWRLMGAWGALALAFLAKGPVAVVFVTVMLIPEIVFTGKFREILSHWKAFVPGLALFFLLVTPWYVAGTLRNGWEFFRGALIEQNLGRFFDEEGRGGPLYYLINLPGQMGIWVLLLPAVFRLAWKSLPWKIPAEFDAVRFLLLGSMLQIAFLSFSSAKISKYLLVCMPFLSILSGEAVLRLGREALHGGLRLSGLAFSLSGPVLIAAGCAAPFLASPYLGISSLWIAPVSLFLGLGGVVSLVLFLRRKLPMAAAVISLALAGSILLFSVSPCLSRINSIKTSRPFAERAARRLDGGTPLLGCGISDCESLFLYYAGRRYDLVPSIGDVVGMRRAGRRFFLLTRRSFFEHLPREEMSGFRELERQEEGKRDYVLVEGIPGGEAR